MPRLRALLAKEVRELLRERLVLYGMIIVPALIMAFMGGLQSAAIHKTAEEAARPPRLAVALEGAPGPGDEELLQAMAAGLNAAIVEAPRDPVGFLERSGYDALVILRPGAYGNLTRGLPVSARVYVRLPHPTPAAGAYLGRVEGALSQLFRALVAARLHSVLPGVTPEFLSQPLRAEGVVVVWGRALEASSYASYTLSIYALPVALIVLITSAVQVGAISMGLEREAKTLEMLLASPVGAGEIVVSKILGVLAVTLLGAASFSAGLAYYYHSLAGAVGAAGQAVSITLEPWMLAVAAASLAMSLYIAGLLGLILSLGAEDLRGAQMTANYFAFLLLVPILAFFVGVTPDPTRGPGALLLADPLYPPLPALLGAAFSRPGLALAALAAQAAHMALWTIVASKLMKPENLIAGVGPLKALASRLRGRRE